MNILTTYRDAIAQEIKAIVPDGDPVAEMMRYHLGLDQGQPVGKYVRPALCLAMCEAWGGDPQIALPGGAALELIHRCSLIFDDIQDQSDYRNGRLALWKVVGPARALNAGLALSCLPRIALHRIANGVDADMVVRVDGVLEEAVVELCRGQDMDVCPDSDESWCPDFDERGFRKVFGCRREGIPESVRMSTGEALFERPSLAWYQEMVRLKTGVLTGAAAGIGAIIAGGFYEESRAFGENLGVLFQLQDDILGVWGDETVTGKPMVDLVNGKLTLVTVVGLSIGTKGLAQFLREARELGMPPEKAASMRAELDKQGVLPECQRVKGEQLKKTLFCLGRMRYLDAGWRVKFRDLAVFVAQRDS